MTSTVGGDLNDLAQLATALRESGRQVNEIKARIDRVVQSTSWTGPAAARFRAREAGISGLDGVVVAVVSGGNVDPARYRELLESPLPE